MEARTRPGQSAELSNEAHLPPNCGHGDPSLTPEGGRHMVLRKDKVEIGNSCAGINRHAAEDERALRERGSDPLDPEFCAGHREVHGEA